ncbi:hypothetical protein Vadar_015291 [Vaccinium darrowii]|uniref:Uncharacterized protein n=1 Tax=Vaccinium darrowii TaxID=229202 RepID=A0ACB7XHL6_9ERIC|nr:hypothetical protein Vadar_015291 [Vaccinium darrowii]
MPSLQHWCSAGGLASFLHRDNFASYLPMSASVKCLSDAGFFLDERDVSLKYTFRSFYEDLVSLQAQTWALSLPMLGYYAAATKGLDFGVS